MSIAPRSENSAFGDLTLLCVSPLFDGTQEAIAAFDKSMTDRLFVEGGFVVTGFPGAEEMDDLAAKMLRFFELPKKEKDRLTIGANIHRYRGYRSTFKQGGWAYNEFFDIGPQNPLPGPGIEGVEIFAEENNWPSAEPCPGWRLAMERYYEIMHRLSSALILSLGRGFGYDDKAIEARYREGNHTMRLLNYPVPPEGHFLREGLDDGRPGEKTDDQSISLSAGRHLDASGLSLLWQAQAGLQAQSPDGVWRNVPMIENSISIHVGTSFQGMTNGKIPSTPHRVLDLKQQRQSVGFFLEPGLTAQMGALEEKSIGDEGTYAWHLLERVSNYDN